MAWQDYIAVCNSNLYDHHGITKSILARICMLIERAEEGQEVTANEGWCTATQAYIAAQLGCSDSKVLKAVKELRRDGWLKVEHYETRRGGKRSKYTLPDSGYQRLLDHQMKKDEDGEFIRTKQTQMRRKPNAQVFAAKSRNASTSGLPTGNTRVARVADAPNGPLAVKQSGHQPGCKTAISRDAKRLIARREVLELDLEKFAEKTVISSKTTSKTQIKSNSQTLGASPRTPPGDFSSPRTPTAHDSASRPPVPPAPVLKIENPVQVPFPPKRGHSSHKWVGRVSNYRGQQVAYENCFWCHCDRTAPAASKMCRPDKEVREEAAAWVAAQEATA